ncbi:MAG: hypothetical protein QG597_3325, partial [Actinomycetota bacterium]|nr:hypothetical protein [Actinomycetota bacterium]
MAIPIVLCAIVWLLALVSLCSRRDVE